MTDDEIKQANMEGRVRAVLGFMVAELKRVGFVQSDDTLPSGARLPSITCPQCQMTSYNANDIRQQYCGYCHQFHEFMKGRPL